IWIFLVLFVFGLFRFYSFLIVYGDDLLTTYILAQSLRSTTQLLSIPWFCSLLFLLICTAASRYLFTPIQNRNVLLRRLFRILHFNCRIHGYSIKSFLTN